MRLARNGLRALAAALVLLAAAGPTDAAARDAFPGAVGHGRAAQGGRDGAILFVTTLADSGPGSLRACVEASGPRNCVFRVAGHIVLKRSLVVLGPRSARLSVYGQTAPGGGIEISVAPDARTTARTIFLVKNTHDVVLQHLRLRNQAPASVRNIDALTIEGSRDVYADHISGAWATDENVNTYAQATRVTIANSIWSEGLLRHSKCALLGSDPTGPQEITFWRNLCSGNNDRNPDVNHFAGSCVEIVDNLFYNARSEWAEVFSQFDGGTPVSLVGNYFKAGPSTVSRTKAIYFNPTAAKVPPRIYANANETWAPDSRTIVMMEPATARHAVDAPPCPLAAPTFGDAARTYEHVLARAGAFPRDAIDERIVDEVGAMGEHGGGAVVSVAGAIPPVTEGVAYRDDDQDGIPDAYEEALGSDPAAADAWTIVADGWSAFEAAMARVAEERREGRYPE